MLLGLEDPISESMKILHGTTSTGLLKVLWYASVQLLAWTGQNKGELVVRVVLSQCAFKQIVLKQANIHLAIPNFQLFL